jgi:myo-inositol-1(or 4)-monophosphatase
MNLPPEMTAELLSTANQSALQAGALLRQKWDEPRHVSQKGFRDWVTDADHASQALIVETIRERFPDHGFLVEEKVADLQPTGPVCWIIDPIDGTSNYSRQQPNFCVSIAAASPIAKESRTGKMSAEILAAVVYDPMRDEMFEAAAGQGAFLNGKRIQVSQTAALESAIVALDWSHQQEKRQYTLEALQRFAHQIHTIRAIGSAALALAWIAAGRLDAYFNLNIKPWDAAAGQLLIHEAGGQIVNHDNHPWQLDDLTCIAGNGLISPGNFVNLVLDQ